jgi:hypothetical protein
MLQLFYVLEEEKLSFTDEPVDCLDVQFTFDNSMDATHSVHYLILGGRS